MRRLTLATRLLALAGGVAAASFLVAQLARAGDGYGAPVREEDYVTDLAGVPQDRLPPPGLCRIWYDELPPDRQPPVMGCARALAVAFDHGGRVVLHPPGARDSYGVTLAAYLGPNDFRGVPPDRVPPPGACRAWFDGAAPDRQPPVTNCRHAEETAWRYGGRVLYMPAE